MRPIQRVEVMPIGEYEAIRPHFRQRVIEEKRPRRVALGDFVSALFENRDSVLLQIQEMLRTERITNESGIAHEIETYNELLPGEGELSISLYVEITDKAERDAWLVKLAGLEDHVFLEVDGERAPAKGRREGASPERTTAVHYLKFTLSPAAEGSIRARKATVALRIDHPALTARGELGPTGVAKLAEDLAG